MQERHASNGGKMIVTTIPDRSHVHTTLCRAFNLGNHHSAL